MSKLDASVQARSARRCRYALTALKLCGHRMCIVTPMTSRGPAFIMQERSTLHGFDRLEHQYQIAER
jgi:hypothetical protein